MTISFWGIHSSLNHNARGVVTPYWPIPGKPPHGRGPFRLGGYKRIGISHGKVGKRAIIRFSK